MNNDSKPGPQLHTAISFHCVIKVDSKTAFVIGGIQNGITSSSTWTVNLEDENASFEIGPILNTGRRLMSCGKMLDANGKTIFVVAGGKDQFGATLDSSEFLDSLQGSWNFGTSIDIFISKVTK